MLFPPLRRRSECCGPFSTLGVFTYVCIYLTFVDHDSIMAVTAQTFLCNFERRSNCHETLSKSVFIFRHPNFVCRILSRSLVLVILVCCRRHCVYHLHSRRCYGHWCQGQQPITVAAAEAAATAAAVVTALHLGQQLRISQQL